jgi:uncharacterized protein (TIGR00251 family)
MSGLVLRSDADSVTLEVRVAPRASRASIIGIHAGALKVSLTAPPVDGAANAALIELLADQLGVAKRSIEITRGERAKHKTVRVRGVTAEQVRALVPENP